ncbi:multiple coagulation factor deficiency protein 2 homolog [Epargyreus clarus]|uniref:multiple coagulation factor deficiency protein 2 homolog n=1 Tax=Epargyreus clarus TaxID=520877 RepID=UPI003C2D4158
MIAKAYLVLMLNVYMAVGMRRGPHHPHGESPVDHKHHHYKPRHSKSMMGDTGLLHDAKHIEEDAVVLTAEALKKMTPEELEFHYFSAHDFDKNSKLDGLELLKAVYHTIEHEAPDPDADSSIEPQALSDMDTFIALVDRTLASDDTDNDGYVSYAEYRAARANNGDRTPRVVTS